MRHIGAPLDPALGKTALALSASDPRYRWNGALPHGLTRAAIRKAHVLVHPSRMEGGANVIVDAVTSGTCVVASRVSGDVGMLGRSYPGYFEAGDAAGLARLLASLAGKPSALGALKRACEARRPLFSPSREKQALRKLVQGLRQAPGR